MHVATHFNPLQETLCTLRDKITGVILDQKAKILNPNNEIETPQQYTLRNKVLPKNQIISVTEPKVINKSKEYDKIDL